MEDLYDDVVDINHNWVVNHRLPLVNSFKPRGKYPLALVMPGHETHQDGIIMPKESEAVLLSNYSDYRMRRRYDDHYIQTVIRGRGILDINPKGIPYAFGKHAAIGWRYQVHTWPHPEWPFHDAPVKYPHLIDLMEHIERPGKDSFTDGDWENWKEENKPLIAAASK